MCYGVGIVSASLNIAMFVRRHGKFRRRRDNRRSGSGICA
jgi:hypothetical protein